MHTILANAFSKEDLAYMKTTNGKAFGGHPATEIFRSLCQADSFSRMWSKALSLSVQTHNVRIVVVGSKYESFTNNQMRLFREVAWIYIKQMPGYEANRRAWI